MGGSGGSDCGQLQGAGCHRVERKVTVEVYRKKRMIVQAKRRWNDAPES
jgi:hypothetical protein